MQGPCPWRHPLSRHATAPRHRRMCGIAGIWSFQPSQGDELAETARRMATALAHRGPDDAGVWADPAAGVALGHRRLSILDLSPAGHQPMMSPNRRFVISFNGE